MLPAFFLGIVEKIGDMNAMAFSGPCKKGHLCYYQAQGYLPLIKNEVFLKVTMRTWPLII